VLQADAILDHALRLLATPGGNEIDCRRSVSACYYAVFHLISEAVGAQVSPPTPAGMGSRIQRVLEHRAMKNAMEFFRSRDSCAKLAVNVGIPCAFSPDLALIAKAFGELQDARHLADYDVVDSNGTIGLAWASDCLDKANLVFETWERVKSTDEAKLFLATLVFGAKWTK